MAGRPLASVDSGESPMLVTTFTPAEIARQWGVSERALRRKAKPRETQGFRLAIYAGSCR